MEKSQKRYTNNDLITLLQVLASDYNKKPTHRAILGDSRLPTHHTYIRRFGTMAEAIELAGLTNMTTSTLHETLKNMVKHYNIAIVRNWRAVGPIIVDLYVEIEDKGRFALDVVAMDGVDHHVVDYIRSYRKDIAEQTLRHGKYIQIADATDIVKFINDYIG